MEETTYYLLKRGKKKFSGIARQIKSGPIVSLYNAKKDADETASKMTKKFSQAFMIKKIDNLYKEMKKCSEQGFSGALLNEKYPIFFMESETNPFLVGRWSDSEKTYLVLDSTNKWQKHDQFLRFLRNYEKVDERLVQMLDLEPFWGYLENLDFYTILRKETEEVFLVEDKLPIPQASLLNMMLYSCEDFAREAISELVTPEHQSQLTSHVISDLQQFVRDADKLGHGVLLNHASHRCLQARLWLHNDQVMLESYSGIWKLELDEEKSMFNRLEQQQETDRELNSSLFFHVEQDSVPVLTFGDGASTSPDAPAREIAITKLSFVDIDDDMQITRTRCLVDRHQIEGSVIEPLVEFIKKIIQKGQLSFFKDNISIIIDGFQDTQKSPSEISDIKKWFQILNKNIPYFIYFLDDHADQVRTYILSLLSETPSKTNGADQKVSKMLFQTIIDVILNGMRFALLAQDDPGDVFQKVFEAFELDPDPDLFENLLQKVEKSLE